MCLRAKAHISAKLDWIREIKVSMESGNVRSGHVRSGKVRSGLVRSGEVQWGQNNLRRPSRGFYQDRHWRNNFLVLYNQLPVELKSNCEDIRRASPKRNLKTWVQTNIPLFSRNWMTGS